MTFTMHSRGRRLRRIGDGGSVIFAPWRPPFAIGMMDTKPSSRIVLGLTGGIAAYKAAELTRLLVKAGISVDVCMTEAACRFITPLTLQALSGRPVLNELWQNGADNGMGHINLTRGATAIVVAPASADFLAKVAYGHADDLLSTLALARDCPMYVAPAMNRQMWASAATQRNIAQLVADGVMVLGPGKGDQACGETGDGRMLEPQEIFEAITAASQLKLLQGRTLLVTAGPTFEAIDPVRGITNTSSGKMGYALAQAAAEAGATVTLISGPTSLPTPAGVARVDVTSAAQMAAAVDANLHSDARRFVVGAGREARDDDPRAVRGAPVARRLDSGASRGAGVVDCFAGCRASAGIGRNGAALRGVDAAEHRRALWGHRGELASR